MYDGVTPTKFGQYAVAEPFRADRLHLHDGSALREVDYASPIPILDQEDLIEQGINTATLVPGARKVDALGSCTCNSGTAHLAERATAGISDSAGKAAALDKIGLSLHDGTQDEEYAIVLYHDVTDQTGQPSQEWPPTDCGSTGLYVMTELQKRGLIAGHKSASGITNVVSLLQGGSVMIGGPFFNAWMETDANGFVDGDGSMSALQDAINSGVAGGHETLLVALERLVLSETDAIEPPESWFRVRNSWSTAYGSDGDYRIHLSTLNWLGSNFDYKQAVVKAA